MLIDERMNGHCLQGVEVRTRTRNCPDLERWRSTELFQYGDNNPVRVSLKEKRDIAGNNVSVEQVERARKVILVRRLSSKSIKNEVVAKGR